MDPARQNTFPGDRDILALLFSIIKLKVYHVFNTYMYSIKMQGIEFAKQSYNFQTLLLITQHLFWPCMGWQGALVSARMYRLLQNTSYSKKVE